MKGHTYPPMFSPLSLIPLSKPLSLVNRSEFECINFTYFYICIFLRVSSILLSYIVLLKVSPKSLVNDFFGSLVGMVLVIVRLYCFLWGKSKETHKLNPPNEVTVLVDYTSTEVGSGSSSNKTVIINLNLKRSDVINVTNCL